MTPVIDATVLPWLAKLSSDFCDGTTFRRMRDIAREEIETVRSLIPSYRRADFDDIADECEAGIARGEQAISEIERRMKDAGLVA